MTSTLVQFMTAEEKLKTMAAKNRCYLCTVKEHRLRKQLAMIDAHAHYNSSSHELYVQVINCPHKVV